MADTTYTDIKDADFTATENRLVWRCHGETFYSNLYRPSAAALAWDKPALNGGEAFAIGNRFGGFSYVTIKVTGRKLTRADGSDAYGMRAQVEMNIGSDSLPEDRSKVTAWVIKGFVGF